METKPLQFMPPPLFDALERPNKSCLNCRHLHRSGVGFTCTAFPDGIPYDIRSGETPHDKPIRGDHGIQWEAASDAPRGLPEGVEGRERI